MTFAGAAIVTGGTAALASLVGARFDEFSRDAAVVLDGPFYTGYFTHLVTMVWHLPAAVALFSALALRRAGHTDGVRLLVAGAVLTAAMALDDLFLLHESVYPVIGLGSEVLLAAYGLAMVAFAVGFRRRLGSNALLIVAAILMWAVSAGVDLTVGGAHASYVVEDGSKAIGVALWSVMLVRQAYRELDTILHRPVQAGS